MKKKVRLPSKPSALILLALKDLASVERLKNKYRVNMKQWLAQKGGKCNVCLAGAVMARSLNLKPKNDRGTFYDMTPSQQNKMFALNSFRVGCIHDGLREMGIDAPYGLNSLHRTFPEYKRGRHEFQDAMLEMVSVLKSFGL
jgi:hypothetical protein